MKKSPPELPPISNYPLYVWRVFAKWLSFFVYGVSAVFLMIFVFPPMKLFYRGKDRFQKAGRKLIHRYFRFFVAFMEFVGVLHLYTGDREAYRSAAGKIVIANHPSFIDVLILFSLLPGADCIVNGSLLRNPFVRSIVKDFYIINTEDFGQLWNDCLESLKQENCLIIFPEGTRTRRSGPIRVKKGAARLSIRTGRPLMLVRIGGNDKYGLGKNDPWRGFNHTERYIYTLNVLPEIRPENYSMLPEPIAARRINNEIKERLFTAEERSRMK
jgi:1-acyl-sn-glycerol-3-phosphate acyltransferase